MTTTDSTTPHAGYLAATQAFEPQPTVSVMLAARPSQVQVSRVPSGRVHIRIGDDHANAWMAMADDEAEELFTTVLAKLGAVRAADQLAAEQACTDGTHSHTLSPVDNLDDGEALECTACFREFVRADDGSLTPVTRTWATPREGLHDAAGAAR